MLIIFAGIVSALAILFVVFKFAPVKKVLAFEKWIDIGSTALLVVMFFGTLGGTMAAIIGGFLISVILWAMKLFIGCDRLTLKGWQEGQKPKLSLKEGSTWDQVQSFWQYVSQQR